MPVLKKFEQELPAKEEARAEEPTSGEAFLQFKYRLIDAVNETLPENEKITADIEAVTLYAENGEFRLRTATGLQEEVVLEPGKKLPKVVTKKVFKDYRPPQDLALETFETLTRVEREAFVEGFVTAMETSREIAEKYRQALGRERREEEQERLKVKIKQEEEAVREHEKLLKNLAVKSV